MLTYLILQDLSPLFIEYYGENMFKKVVSHGKKLYRSIL